jgi:peptide-methionine (S)-S-oxide reductase
VVEWKVAKTMTAKRKWARVVLGIGLLAVTATACTSVQQPTQTPAATAQPRAVTATAVDQPVPARPSTETLILAGGCFWGVQGLFQHVVGVNSAESGYIGGSPETANYDAVDTGDTAHTEAVRIAFDPARVTESQLLQVFFTVVDDPIHLTRLGTDGHARQYQSAIYVRDQTQRDVAQSTIAQMDQTAAFAGPIITAVLPTTQFYPAERYHQDFMYVNPTQPYIAGTEMPKLANLKRQFPNQYRENPVLMFAEDA